MSRPIITRPAWIVLLPLILLAELASATAVFPVGTGIGCGYPTIQAAVDAALIYPGDDDYIYVSRSLTYTAQAITISNQTVHIVGGFDDCQDNEASGKTIISGAGGATEPVFRINGDTGSLVTMRNLVISGGDEDSGGYGGGIYYRGNGVLQIDDSDIINNIAGYGGGIYAEGTGNAAELIIGNNVTVASNTARGSGGGIYVDSLEMTMIAPGSILAFNSAQGTISDGYGGGLLVNSIDYGAYAYLGSNGQGTLGLIYGNDARYGGGVAVVASNDEDRPAVLELDSVDVAQPARVRANFASTVGGGLYLRPTVEGIGQAAAEAHVLDAYIDENQAPDGAAVYLDSDSFGALAEDGGYLFLTGGQIVGNAAVDVNSQPTGGSVLHGGGSTIFSLDRVAIENNQGGRLLHTTGAWFPVVYFRNALLAGNQTSLELLHVDGEEAYLSVDNTTVAANSVGGAQVAVVDGGMKIERSILWQPGMASLQHSGGELIVTDVIASEIASLGGGPAAIMAAPRFIDPGHADYGLRAASFAVDFAPAITGDDRDLNGLPRDQDLSVKANFRGPRDIGALERQALLPLVLNQDFDADLNLWPLATANSADWDVSENIAGAAGSGSIHVSLDDAPQARVIAAIQCIHVPGPSMYGLNGWGRSIGAAGIRDSLLLHWEYRIDGGEACNAGPPTAVGDHLLTTSPVWTRPAVPAYIDVPDSEFTGNSSITVFLVVVDNEVSNDWTVSGWFDGITLEPDTDLIFADGFE